MARSVEHAVSVEQYPLDTVGSKELQTGFERCDKTCRRIPVSMHTARGLDVRREHVVRALTSMGIE